MASAICGGLRADAASAAAAERVTLSPAPPNGSTRSPLRRRVRVAAAASGVALLLHSHLQRRRREQEWHKLTDMLCGSMDEVGATAWTKAGTYSPPAGHLHTHLAFASLAPRDLLPARHLD